MLTPEEYLSLRFAKDPSVVSRKIVDEVLLIPLKRTAEEINSIYTMNEVASRIWELIDGQRQVKDIGSILVAEFNIDWEAAQADLIDFLKALEAISAIKAV